MIRLDHVGKRYADGTVAVRDLSLEVGRGELVVLIGPSGCGKTTTMKMVNRLVEPTTGRIVVDGRDVTADDPVELRRRIGYVIQHVGLFPHQTIESNVATVPTLLGWDRRRRRDRAHELLALVGLDPAVHARRYPHQLSGGQRQRVGVARALAADPPVLLMDEPFGAVDPIARGRLQEEFHRLQRDLGKTVVFVTHDLDEAVLLGDRVAVLSQGGVLEQYAAPAALLARPASGFVAEFLGAQSGLRRLGVTPIEPDLLEQPTWVRVDEASRLAGWVDGTGSVHEPPPAVPVGSALDVGLSAVLDRAEGWVPVVDGERYLGVLTPEAAHRMLQALSVPVPSGSR